jgi:hypothetical protein
MEDDMEERAKRIAGVISEMLDAIERHEPERLRRKDFRAYDLNELEKRLEDGEFFLQDPIGESLRRGLREAGRILAKSFGTDVMEDVANAAAGDSDWRSYVIDKHWDGILAANGDVWIA